MCSREEQLVNEIKEEFCERVIPSGITRYLKCLSIQDTEKVQAVEKQDGITTAAEILLQRLVRRPDWLHDLQRVLLIKDVGLLDFGEKLEEKCRQFNVTIGSKGECIDGHECGEKEEQTIVKSPTTEAVEPTVSQPIDAKQESNADIRKRLVLTVYDTLFKSLKSKDDFPEIMSYADQIISRIDEVSNKCIVISFRMETVEKLDAFWNLYHSGGLISALTRDIITPIRRQQMIIEAQSNGIELSDEDFQMQVYIKESDYLFVRDILTHKDEPLAPRNSMESVILHGTGSSFQTQHDKNKALREYQRILSFRMLQMFDDPFVRDSIPDYLVQLAKLGAFEAVQLFYQSIIQKLETESKHDFGNPNVCYLAYLLSSTINNECQYTDNGDNVELQVGEQGISFDHEDWKVCLNYLMVISNRIRFNSTLLMTFLLLSM